MKQRIMVLGAGSWGTAIAHTLAENGHDVLMWCLEPSLAQAIEQVHRNDSYLPGFDLHPSIKATSDLVAAFSHSDIVVEAIPVAYLRSVLATITALVPDAAKKHWIMLSKGIEMQTHFMPSQILQNILGSDVIVSVVGGPSFAKDLMEKALTAVMVASIEPSCAVKVKGIFENDFFKIHLSDDVLGIQLGGALKNVLAIASGIAHGASMKDNTIAYMMTRGVAEMGMLMTALGGKQETMYGLAGFGDMILTCTSMTSKNFKAGMFIGKGIAVAELLNYMPVLPEGINTCQSLYTLLQERGIQLPLLTGVYEAVFENKSLIECMRQI